MSTRAAVLRVALAAALLVFAANARVPLAESADREVGRLAPDFEVIDVWNGPSSGFSGLRDLRGRVIVLEWFRVDCPHCQAAVARLGAIQRSRFDAGVRVLGVCRQPADRIAQFVREFGVGYLVARTTVEALEESGIAAYPEAFVIGSDGRVLWSGAPASLDDRTLDRLLVAGRPWPPLSPAMDPATHALRSDDVAAARALLDPCARSADACDTASSESSRTILAWIDAWGARLDEVGAAEWARGEPFEAFLAWDRLATAFARTPAGDLGRQRVATLLADPKARREVAAGQALREARWRVAAADAAAAASAFDAVAAAHPGTKAAVLATAAAGRARRRN